MEDLDEDFSRYRRDSFRRRALGRSLSSRMLLESSISSDCALLTKYERLSQSMRSPDEQPPRQRKCGIWRLLAHVLLARRAIDLPRKASNRASSISREFITVSSSSERVVRKEASTASWTEAEAKKKQQQKKIKRRSSWLPDPEKRWPVQGW